MENKVEKKLESYLTCDCGNREVYIGKGVREPGERFAKPEKFRGIKLGDGSEETLRCMQCNKERPLNYFTGLEK